MRVFAFAAIIAAGVAAAAPSGAFEVASPDIEAGGLIEETYVADVFGCSGGNVSPALVWKGAPAETLSYAVMMHDPDAPTGGAGFWHWIVLDIPASESGLDQGAGASDATLPKGARHVRNDYSRAGWGGPCPPEADPAHRYNFTVYALPVETLDIPAGASKAVIGFVVNATAIGEATFQGLYARNEEARKAALFQAARMKLVMAPAFRRHCASAPQERALRVRGAGDWRPASLRCP